MKTKDNPRWLLPSSRAGTHRSVIAISKAFDIPVARILGRSRIPRVAWARQVLMYLTVEICGMSAAEVGRWLGRDHGTVGYAIQHVRDVMSVYPELKAEIEEIERKL